MDGITTGIVYTSFIMEIMNGTTGVGGSMKMIFYLRDVLPFIHHSSRYTCRIGSKVVITTFQIQ